MDLPSHPLTLVEHPGLAGLREQLRVQAGVLPQRRLELRVGLGQLRRSPACALSVCLITPIQLNQPIAPAITKLTSTIATSDDPAADATDSERRRAARSQ